MPPDDVAAQFWQSLPAAAIAEPVATPPTAGAEVLASLEKMSAAVGLLEFVRLPLMALAVLIRVL